MRQTRQRFRTESSQITLHSCSRTLAFKTSTIRPSPCRLPMRHHHPHVAQSGSRSPRSSIHEVGVTKTYLDPGVMQVLLIAHMTILRTRTVGGNMIPVNLTLGKNSCQSRYRQIRLQCEQYRFIPQCRALAPVKKIPILHESGKVPTAYA
jgi:hypothetical protein